MNRVLIFAERMLPSTQTFIPLQVNELQRYSAKYIGLIPAERNYVLRDRPVMLTHNRSLASRWRREIYRWVGCAPRFHSRLRHLGAKVIHAHFAEGGPPAFFLSSRLNLPLVVHLRGGAEMMTDEELRKHAFELPFLIHRRKLFERSSLFLCVSHYIRDKAIATGFPSEKLQVHYTGMNCRAFNAKLPVSEKDPDLVLYVGRLVRYKGCDYLLRAMCQVQQRRPEAKLVVIGDGDFRAELETLKSSLGVRCTFLGEQSQTVIREWLEKARVFCGPSVTLEGGMSEAFGNVFSEAQAMGVPVVSFRHGGIPETLCDGVTGLLAAERDVEALTSHLLRYLEDTAFWAYSREEGMRWVRREFDVRAQTAKLETIYDRVIEHFQPRSFSQTAPEG